MHAQNKRFRLRALAGVTVLAGVMMLTPAAAASPIQITGSSAGCFLAGCSSFESAASGPFDLTFTGTNFDVLTAPDGLTSLGLGSIARGNSQIGSTDTVPFL